MAQQRSGNAGQGNVRRHRGHAGRVAKRLCIVVTLALLLSTGFLRTAPPVRAAEIPPVGYLEGKADEPGEPLPRLDLPPSEVALTVDGIPYPLSIIEGYLHFARSQAAASGNPRTFYEWGEILHLFDTAAERLLSARAAWDEGFRATSGDMTEFSKHTRDSTPGYLEAFYDGSAEVFLWDAEMQILMKKWMAFVTHGERDVSWVEAGRLMRTDEREVAAWQSWYRAALQDATVERYPEVIRRSGESAPRAGIALLLLMAAGSLLLTLRVMANGPRADLLRRWPWIRWTVRKRLFPEGAQFVSLVIFLLILGSLAFGPTAAHRNLGSVYLWILWWPLVPFLLFFSARSWCAVCPVATVGDLAQKLPSLGRRPAPRWLAVAGIWLIEATFLAITWFDRSFGLVDSTRLTLTALLLLTGVALTVSVLFSRRTFCRSLCFFGALAGNYSMSSVVELRARTADCRGCRRAACLHSRAAETASDGCPMKERPRALAGNRECNLCLTCVRSCQRQSLALRVRDPIGEPASVRRPRVAVAALAAILVGVVTVQNLGMLESSLVLERRLGQMTGLGHVGLTSLVYSTALLLPLLLLLLAARGKMRTFAFFGYALIPLDMGAHAAHNLLHLLGEGKSVWWVTARLFGLASPLDIPGGHPGGSMGAALLDIPTIRVLQVALVLTAGAASLAVARRLHRRLGGDIGFLPLYILLVALIGFNLWMFSVPMALRH